MKSQRTSDQNNLLHSLLAGVTGTTAMTAFSYLVSEKHGRYFKEPEILNDLLYRLLKASKNGREPLPGFLAHYATGSLFSMAYHLLPEAKAVLKELRKGILLGLGFGLVGVGIWNAVFKLHPDPPRIHLKDFLGHLIVAHVIFGEALAVTTSLLQAAERGSATCSKGPHDGTSYGNSVTGDVIARHLDSRKASRSGNYGSMPPRRP